MTENNGVFRFTILYVGRLGRALLVGLVRLPGSAVCQALVEAGGHHGLSRAAGWLRLSALPMWSQSPQTLAWAFCLRVPRGEQGAEAPLQPGLTVAQPHFCSARRSKSRTWPSPIQGPFWEAEQRGHIAKGRRDVLGWEESLHGCGVQREKARSGGRGEKPLTTLKPRGP